MSNFKSSAIDTTFTQSNLGGKLLKLCKKVASLMSLDKKTNYNLSLNLYCKNTMKIALR